MTWGEEVAQRRIARAKERGSASLWLDRLGLAEIPAEIRQLKNLRGLYVPHNQITSLPDWLPELRGLTRLNLAHNYLSDLPDWIGDLGDLHHLQLAGNPLAELPESMLHLPELRTLGLAMTDVKQLPASIGRLPLLRALYLGGLPLDQLPEWLASMTGLAQLGIERLGMTALPSWLADLYGLRKLWLGDNALLEVPRVLRSLSRLEILDVGSNGIDRLPDWIGELRSLQVLIATDNRLTALPDSLGALTGLRTLHVAGNRLTELPETLDALTRITDLRLGRNELTGVPDCVGRLAGLRHLDLDGCALTELPESLRNLKNLSRLQIQSNHLTVLPDWIGELTHLRAVYAIHNQLSGLPDGFARLSALEVLSLFDNRIAQLPAAIGELPSLTDLELSGNELRSLPDKPPRFPRIRRLYLSGNKLVQLPDWVCRLPRLTRLIAAANEFTAVPGSLRGHPRLESFVMGNPSLGSFPDWMGELPSLIELSIGSPTLTAVPGWIRRLSRLRHLWMEETAISELPEWLGELRELETLGLYKLPLQRLPESMAQLHRLRFLNVNATALTELPDWIGGLTRLATLAAGEGELERIPDSIGALGRLKLLYLAESKISDLPSSVGELRSLEYLRLADAHLRAVPSTLGQLKRLRNLELQNNRIAELPTALLELPLLEELAVHGNPLLSPPPEISAAGTGAVLDFLTERKKGSAQQWDSKVLVVGEGGVGKTSMIKRLIEEAFDPQENTTHGMRTYVYMLAHPSRTGVTMSLNVWDFGGQEIYHATHQFFLTDRSLFVLLWNARLGWEQGRLRYWLDIIAARAPESPVLLVATHAPAGGRPVDLPLEDLKREYPRLAGSIAIDNETGDGLAGLVARIGVTASGLPLMGTEWPHSWLDAAEAVQRIRDNHVTPARLWRTMSEAGLLDPRHQRYVAEALHALGAILYHSQDPELRDTVIIRPEWVNEYISRVLDDPEVERRHGLLRRSRLDELWAELDRGMRDHFLAMMDKYDLSYKTGTEYDDDVSLVVERLPWQAPDYRVLWDRDDSGERDDPRREADEDEPEHEIRVVYELSTMPPGIPTWFIARSHRFSTNTHWRTGALLAHPDGRHRALIRGDREGRKVELAVRGPAPAGFFALLDDGLNLTLERYPGLSIRCMVPCPCRPDCREFYDYRDLQRRITRKKPLLEIECRKSNEMVHVPLLLLGLPPSDRDEIRSALTHISRQNAALDGRLSELVGDQQRMFLKLQQQIHSGLETKCPSVFTIVGTRQAGHFTAGAYELHLYCEEPGAWHPLPDEAGVYVFPQLPGWLVRMAPHLRTVVSLLKHAAPLASPVLGAACAHLDARLGSDVELMAAVIDRLPAFDGPQLLRPEQTDPDSGTGATGATGGVSGPLAPSAGRPSSEADYRSLQDLLTELDPRRIWGGLCRVTTPEGLTLYLCRAHADSYES